MGHRSELGYQPSDTAEIVGRYATCRCSAARAVGDQDPHACRLTPDVNVSSPQKFGPARRLGSTAVNAAGAVSQFCTDLIPATGRSGDRRTESCRSYQAVSLSYRSYLISEC